MRPPLGPWWPLLWLPPLTPLPAGGVRGEEAAALSVSKCTMLKEIDSIKTFQSNCYCYNQHSQMEWTAIWSTVQVKITSPGLFTIVYITESHHCQYPETILSFTKCVIHNFWAPKESNDVTIIIHPYVEMACFSVKPAGEMLAYKISVKRNIVDFKLLLACVVGVFMFFRAKVLSQSPVFYYSSGTVLGVLMPLVFILLWGKRYIPKYSTFWALMVGCWFASVYVVYQLMEDMNWLWYENRIFVLGYVLTSGPCSFAVCYRHGPLTDSRSLLMWTLRFLSLALIYAGMAMPQIAYTLMVLLVSFRYWGYPLRAFSYIRWKMKEWFQSKKLVVRFLSEEEYREQAEAETTSALEELRQACRRADFPSWLAVSKLQAPKKFAEFVLGASHLSPEEIRQHEEQYGLGGAFLEEQLFSLQADGLPTS